jgi:hypothetical protein
VAESRWHPPILVTFASPTTFDHDDFAALVWELFEETEFQAHEIQIQLGYFYGDVWPPDWTWVSVVLDEAGRTAIDAVAAAIVTWGTNWIRERRKREPDAQPIKAVILGPDGNVLREVEVPADRD